MFRSDIEYLFDTLLPSTQLWSKEMLPITITSYHKFVWHFHQPQTIRKIQLLIIIASQLYPTLLCPSPSRHHHHLQRRLAIENLHSSPHRSLIWIGNHTKVLTHHDDWWLRNADDGGVVTMMLMRTPVVHYGPTRILGTALFYALFARAKLPARFVHPWWESFWLFGSQLTR